jgi:serine protease Do
MYNDKTRYKGKLVGTDPTTDLAVIKIDQKNLPVAALGNSDNVQIGEWVLAIGNPLGLTSTVTAGIVSAIGRAIGIIGDNYGIENFIQTDAAINPGNSGGALVNMRGEVVGINTAIASTNMRYQGYGFAVPVNIMKTVAMDLITSGSVRRGYIGVQIGEVDQTLANGLGLEKAQGVIVQSLVKGGAGEAAGLKDGDVIFSIDGKEVDKPNELQSYIATKHAGDVVNLKIFREGRTFDRKITLKQREDEKPARNVLNKNDEGDFENESRSATVNFDKLGMSVRSLTAAEKKDGDVDNGVFVSSVERFGEAAERRIGESDIILEADRKPVKSPADLKKVIEAKKPGDSVLLRVKRQNTTQYIAVQIPR